jgi:hypothetical protein
MTSDETIKQLDKTLDETIEALDEAHAEEQKLKVFVPWWVVLEFLDSAKYDPFIECRILKQYSTQLTEPNGEMVEVYDLEIKEGLIIPAMPITYTIQRQDLKEWSRKIADWILEFPEALDAD